MRQQQYTLPLGDAIAIAAHLDGLTFNGSDYNERHDKDRLTRQVDRLYHFMKDGRWRTLAEIERSTGIPAASASAQLRNLRKIGTNFSKRPRGDRSQGLWEYRLEADKQSA